MKLKPATSNIRYVVDSYSEPYELQWPRQVFHESYVQENPFKVIYLVAVSMSPVMTSHNGLPPLPLTFAREVEDNADMGPLIENRILNQGQNVNSFILKR